MTDLLAGKRILLTGAGGFVGSHALRHLLSNTAADLVCPVTFRHHGNPDRITSAYADHPEWAQRVDVVTHDLTTPVSCTTLDRFGDIDYLLNIASESHVDRSIEHPGEFIRNNVDLMLNVLDLARVLRPRMVLQMSTDEVYGPAANDYRHKEWDAIAPSNPYSASKAAQEAIAFSYWRTYGVPVVITNTMNIIGEMQDPEKFVPMVIRKLQSGEPITVHTDADGVPGSRFYLHARNLADAWLYLMDNEGHTWDLAQYADGSSRPSRFNIVGEREVDNIEMVMLIADAMGVDRGQAMRQIQRVDFHSSRPGHDLRYALDGKALADLHWRAPIALEPSLKKTVQWALDHPEWLCS
jgi:dTDP-glucose 4,6-dehydratase